MKRLVLGHRMATPFVIKANRPAQRLKVTLVHVGRAAGDI